MTPSPALLAARTAPEPPRTCYGCTRPRPASMFGPTAVPGGTHFHDRCSICRGRMNSAQRDYARESGRCEWFRCERPQAANFRCAEHALPEDLERNERHARARAYARVQASPIRFPRHDDA